MKTFRAFLYFLVGFLLSACAVLAQAETINATLSTTNYKWVNTSWCSYFGQPCSSANGLPWATVNKAVADKMAQQQTATCTSYYPEPSTSTANNGCTCLRYDNVTMQCATSGAVRGGALYECPSGQNWTLSGTTCTRPDCVAPQVRNPSTGICEAPPSRCAGKDQTPASYAWVSFFKGQSPYGYRCVNGCKVVQTGPVDHPTMNPTGETYVGGTHDFHHLMKTQYFSEECTVGESGAIAPEPTVDPSKNPPPNIKEPKCAASEGVLTSSSGKVSCVPQGTVEARTPIVKTEKKTETFADNSTRTTETVTTTDPATSVFHTGTTVTATGGQSGAAGTSTSSGTSSTNSSGTGTAADGEGGGGGDCDPKKDFCGGPGTGGLYEKKSKTVASVVGDFKTGLMSSPVGSASTGFFTVSTPSGACPNWVVEVPFLNVTLNLSQHFCTSTAISMMQLVGAVLMFVAAFVGFRWAIL